MSDSIDDLLAQIKASNASPNKDAAGSMQPPAPIAPGANPMPNPTDAGAADNLDHLLAKIDGQEASPTSPTSKLPISKLPTSNPVQTPDRLLDAEKRLPPASTKDSTDDLLTEIKAIYQEYDRAEDLKTQQQRQEEQQQQVMLKRQRQVAIVKKAEAWLKTLDAKSSEAAWFEEFASKYASRIEAAVDYLGLNENS